jgi:membrane protein required for colicin V production
MNWLDAVLGIILLASLMSGFSRGFTRQIVGLVSGVAALLLGIWFYGVPAGWFASYVSSPALAKGLGFAVVFCGVLIVGGAVGAVIHRFLTLTGLSFLDRLLGGGLGFLRGALVCMAIVMGAMAFSRGDKPPDAIVNSRLSPYVAEGARVVVAMAPHDLKETFHKTYAQVRSTWEEALKKGIHNKPDGDKKKNESHI